MLPFTVARSGEDAFFLARQAGLDPILFEDGSNVICFQKVDDYKAPVWPGQDVPQQIHMDVVVDDLDAGEAAVLELGATKTEYQPGTTFRVFLDPAGHPFCLCLS